MIYNLVFSKDRPLQLDAYLASLVFCTGINERNINIIIDKPLHYKRLMDEYSLANWIVEEQHGSFDQTLKNFFSEKTLENDDLVLFGCDDCVFTRQLHLKNTNLAFAFKDIAGFSLRLGLNIGFLPQRLSSDFNEYYFWHFPSSASHYGYPMDLMGSIYTVDLVRDIIKTNPNKFRCPNDLESWGVHYLQKSNKQFMAMFNSSNYLVAQDVNRVQNLYENKFTGTDEQSPEKLIQLYNEGHRIDWTNLFNISYNDVFVGNSFWKVI